MTDEVGQSIIYGTRRCDVICEWSHLNE